MELPAPRPGLVEVQARGSRSPDRSGRRRKPSSVRAPSSMREDPVGQLEHGARRFAIARQVVVVQQARGVVVFVARPAAVRPARVGAAVGAMRAGRRGLVVIGVPEQAAVERRLVVLRVIDVDVDDVPRGVDHELAPAIVAGAQEVHARAVHEVVLIVVVRDERLAARGDGRPRDRRTGRRSSASRIRR